MAVASPEGFLVSQDATNWTFRAATVSVPLSDVAGGAGFWVGWDSRRRALYSTDLVNWSDVQLRTSYGFNSVAYGRRSFVLAGNNGLWQSDPLITLVAGAAWPSTLTLCGPRDAICEVQCATNAANPAWQAIGTVTLSNESGAWPVPATPPNAFYRAVLQ